MNSIVALLLVGLVAVSGEPLFLSEMIKNGKIEEAQNASRVYLPGLPSSLISYSGYVTVNASSNGHTFFWYFPPLNGNLSAPTLMWLQGGPGGSSLFALFSEMGPIMVNNEGTQALPNELLSWTREYGMVFVDNPVGVGFSLSDPDGLAQSKEQYMTTLYSFISQFFQLFPALQKNDFFITGESYAGKYVPAAAYRVLEENKNGTLPFIPLKGIMIGDGLCDPATMIPQYPYVTQSFSLVDWNEVKVMQSYADKASQYMAAEQWVDAFHQFDLMINGDLTGVPPYLANVSGFTDYFNALSPKYSQPFGTDSPFQKYLNLPEIQKALHVNKTYLSYTKAVEVAIINDIAQSVKQFFPALLENYKVLLYSGQFDVIVGAHLTIPFIRSIQWPGHDAFDAAPRTIWHSRSPVLGVMGKLLGSNDVAGYHTQAGNLNYVIVRNAGHMVPTDQPLWALDMVTRFIEDISFAGPVPSNIPDPQPPTTIASELHKLADLHRAGDLTDAEYAAAKKNLLGL
eukprot:TRINITY_DN33683_c0_g1_i1.p1 TRINITY_DN33683_c0_g1~~TRINITY_DN33683_c0_g1_i1.p1  ORF type:complete len:513 (+),score=127.70 TRINITY_DN33683_c0_g1_i1:81-1619(+)